jgi:4'-phosphopantetheinyl transferase
MWELTEEQVHSWFVAAGRFAAGLPELSADLCLEERQRAARFLFERDRVRYTICRALLRRLLAGYGAGPTPQFPFVYSPRGKPELPVNRNPTDLHFNLAHSGEVAVIGVARRYRLGVDVEQIRPLSDPDSLVRVCFAPEEQAEFRSLPGSMRLRAFFAGWARKEAFVKATGEGLGRRLASFAVAIAPDTVPRVLRVGGDCNAGAGWTLLDLPVGERYAAAVAVDRPGVRVLARDLSPSLLGLPEKTDAGS